MKRFSLWLYRWCWRREVAEVRRVGEPTPGMLGTDYLEGFENGIEYALETLQLHREPK